MEQLTKALNPIRNTLSELRYLLEKIEVYSKTLTREDYERALHFGADVCEYITIEAGIRRKQNLEPLLAQCEAYIAVSEILNMLASRYAITDDDIERSERYRAIAEFYKSDAQRTLDMIVSISFNRRGLDE